MGDNLGKMNKLVALSLALVALVAFATAAPVASRRAIFFEEQRAGKVEYTNWPPVACKADGDCVGLNASYCMGNQTVLHTFTGDINFPSAVVVDNENGYIFVQVEGSLSTGGQLWRIGLDGSNPTNILKDIVRAYGVAADIATKTLYYVQGGHGGFIGSVSYDGKLNKNVLEGLDYPYGVAVDQENKRIVFTTSGVGDGVVTTMKFDGSDVQHVANFGFAPMGVSFGVIPY